VSSILNALVAAGAVAFIALQLIGLGRIARWLAGGRAPWRYRDTRWA
jgi:hypothetical protein